MRARTRTSRYEPDAVEVALVLTRLAPDRAVVVGRLDWPFARPNGRRMSAPPFIQLARHVGRHGGEALGLGPISIDLC
jgi:hypothetical protein